MSLEKNTDQQVYLLIKDLNEKKYDKVIFEAELLLNENKLAILYNLIGVSYYFKDIHKKAIEFYQEAIKLEPNNEETYRNLGKSFLKIKQFDNANNSFKKSIKLKPNNADAYFNVGLTQLEKDNYLDSIKYFKKAIEYNKKFYQAFYNLGKIYYLIGDTVESEKNYKQTIQINKSHIKAMSNLASLYINNNKTDNAIELLKNCLEIEPNYIPALTNLGVALQDKKLFLESLSYFNRVIKNNSKSVKALTQKLFIKRKLCDWSSLDNQKNNMSIINSSNEEVTPWQLLCLCDDMKEEFERAKKYARQFKVLRTNVIKNNKNSKIRIGYFTPDFHHHAGMINMECIFKHHDRSKFEIFAFDYGFSNNDETHIRIKRYFDKFYYVSEFSDKEIADLAIKNKIDIAIHRNGYAQNSRSNIFSYNPSILKINYLGYPGTTALESIDYIIADNTVIPKENELFFKEKIIFMPNTYYPADNSRIISHKKYKRSDIGIPKNAFVLSCFNNSYKISNEEFNIWMQIMKQNKNTYLILLIKDDICREYLLKELKKNKIDKKRLVFVDYIKPEYHLSRHTLSDLFLDTFNYNGHTSAIDSLLSGLPIVTKMGNSFSARVCSSILKAFDMPELITNNNNEYLNLINKLILDKNYYKNILKKTKKNINTSNLFNTKKYVKDFEKGLEIAFKNKADNNIVKNIVL